MQQLCRALVRHRTCALQCSRRTWLCLLQAVLLARYTDILHDWWARG
mgnify:CR=1 FL=1